MPEIITLARRILVFKEQEIVDEINDLNERERSYEDICLESELENILP